MRRANNLPRSKPPDTKLQLERVHGYRGYDCRDNMTFIASGELVGHRPQSQKNNTKPPRGRGLPLAFPSMGARPLHPPLDSI